MVIADVVLALPAIAESRCTLRFSAFDMVLQTAFSWIPGVGTAISGWISSWNTS